MEAVELGSVYEYGDKIALDGRSAISVPIPESVIFDSDGGDKLVTAFMFFYVTRGIDCRTMFTVNWMVEWSGKKPDRHTGSINDKFANAIDRLVDIGYLSLDGKPSNSKKCVATFDKGKVSGSCDGGYFGLVYLDELDKIISWTPTCGRDVDNDLLLRVFAYLRRKIVRRRNEMFGDEIDCDGRNNHTHDVEQRRLKKPDAYNGYYCDMADELGISPKAMSRAVDALCDMGLIYVEQLPRTKADGKWRTNCTVFCNSYKREGGYLLASGAEYYAVEVANKKKLLRSIGVI